MNQLFAWDQAVFRYLNSGISNPFFDILMPFARNAPDWIPFYVFFAAFLVLNFRIKGLYVILFAVFAVVLSDQVASALIKPLVHRLRPCYDPNLHGQVRLLLQSCGGKYGFPSSHASNHFTMAIYLISMMPKKIKWVTPVLLVWASLVAFAQIYVGVHFPIDVICGAILGCLIGWLFASLCKQIMKVDLDKELETTME